MSTGIKTLLHQALCVLRVVGLRLPSNSGSRFISEFFYERLDPKS